MLDRFMASISSFDLWIVPIVTAILLVIALGGFRARAMLVVLGLTIAVSEALVAKPLKSTVRRPRPHEVLADVRIVGLKRSKDLPRFLDVIRPLKISMSRPGSGEIGGRSLPSAHTINNFAVATVFLVFYRGLGLAWLAVASAVGYSRIYVGSHWPSDIAISILLGVGLTLLLLPLYEMLWRAIGSRVMPRCFALHPSLLARDRARAAAKPEPATTP